jgi:hypothetical protein
MVTLKMNFQYIPGIETSKDILEIAFRKAREREGNQRNCWEIGCRSSERKRL